MIIFNEKQIKKYVKKDVSGTGYLAFRDLQYFSSYINQCDISNVLDVGCGAGRSTRCLMDFCDNVYGTDICLDILKEANLLEENRYFHTNLDKKPYAGSPYTTIFSILVMFHIQSIEEMHKFAYKIKKSLKKNGYLILVVGSPDLYTKKFSTVSSNNATPPKSGANVKIYLRDLEVTDYFWDIKCIINVFSDAGFSYLSMHSPLGSVMDNNPIPYIDELFFAPYSYLCFKSGEFLE